MSISERDRKIVIVVIPLLAVVAYWFLLLAPKRDEASKIGAELTELEKKRDDATAKAAKVEQAKTTFARDYRDVVRLGKAIPSTVDMPSLIVQLDQAARGTGIKFTRIKAGQRSLASGGTQGNGASGAASSSSSSSSSSGGSGSGGSASATPAGGGAAAGTATPAQGGPQPAQSAPGGAAQTASNTANKASGDAGAAGKTTGEGGATDTTTSSSSKQGGLPVGGGSGAGAQGGSSSAAPGLDSVPLEFTFDGSFFDLADFFHRLKRFVRVTNKDVLVRGRLMTIDSMKFVSEETTFPSLKVEVKATVFLSPKGQGATAGASSQGPAQTQTAGSPAQGSGGSPPPSTPPTASATP